MNPELAEDLLRAVMEDAADAEFPRQLGILRALATYKYDDYQQYAPGQQFIASLAGWLNQFEAGLERKNALRFVQERLIYISDIEMRHLVNLMARDLVPATLQREVATRLCIPSYRITRVRDNPEFARSIKASLFLGMSDGARIDQFRRGNPALSNEQFAMTYELNSPRARSLRSKLEERLGDESSGFEYIFLVDDFSASGRTILSPDEKGHPDGRLHRFINDTLPLLHNGVCPKIFVTLYIATAQAVDHLEAEIVTYPEPPWTQDNVPQVLAGMRIEDKSKLVCGREGAEFEPDRLFDQLLHKYYDCSIEDEHKGNVQHGYSNCGLPLVLPHNTPNNSVFLLWEKEKTRPLFPRYERHQSRLEE